MKKPCSKTPWTAYKNVIDPKASGFLPYLVIENPDGHELAVLNGNPTKMTPGQLAIAYTDAVLMAKAPVMARLLRTFVRNADKFVTWLDDDTPSEIEAALKNLRRLATSAVRSLDAPPVERKVH